MIIMKDRERDMLNRNIGCIIVVRNITPILLCLSYSVIQVTVHLQYTFQLLTPDTGIDKFTVAESIDRIAKFEWTINESFVKYGWLE